MKHNIIIDAAWGFPIEIGAEWPGCRLDIIAKEFSDEEKAVVEDIVKSAAALIRDRLNELNPEVTA